MYKCPCCGKDVSMEHFSCKAGEKGGKSGRGDSKRRDPEKMRRAALLRWHRRDNVSNIGDTGDAS